MARGEFEPPFDRSKALGFDSEHLLRSENIPFDIDNWYPALRAWTFESEFVPLSRLEARAIARYYRARFLGRERHRFTPADAAVLQALEDRLDIAIAGHFGAEGCFLRLCGRSPKDADPLDRGRVRREYEAALASLSASLPAGGELSDELRMRAAAGVGSLRVRSGAEALSLLLTSERVYSDMLDWLWYGEPEQVVLRRWEPEMSVDLEFRLYVHENRLTAISQYDHHCRYDHLFGLRDKLRPRMVDLWKSVHPHVGAASYAMDFAYLPKRDELKLLELSPFLRCTGAHCFRWGCPEDVDVLEGRRPAEFRLVEQPSARFGEMFRTGWEQRWYSEDPPPYWEYYQTWRQRRLVALRQRLRRRLLLLLPRGCGRSAGAAWALPVGAALAALSTLRPRLAGAALLAGAAALLAREMRERVRRRSWAFLFVYGTLKRGMHWNRKFLSHGACFVGDAQTLDRFPLVTGRCGVPYMLVDQRGAGHRVRGELWRVDADSLEGLDQYEGVDKSYYCRPMVEVEVRGRKVLAGVYSVPQSPPSLRRLPHLEEYTLQWHQQRYRAVEHILLKQRMYLQGHAPYSCRSLQHPPCSLEEDAAAEPRSYEPRSPTFAGA